MREALILCLTVGMTHGRLGPLGLARGWTPNPRLPQNEKLKHRMDDAHLQSVDRMLEGLARLRALLCRDAQ